MKKRMIKRGGKKYIIFREKEIFIRKRKIGKKNGNGVDSFLIKLNEI